MRSISIFTYLILINSFLINSAYSLNHNKKIILRKSFDKFTILGDVDYRNKDKDDKDLYHRHYDLGFRVMLANNWSGALKYRNIYRKSEGEWNLFEQRPQLQITNIVDYSLIKIKTRIREEYRIRNGDDFFRTRLRLDVKSKKSFLNLKPFINNEFFYDHEKSRYNRNRFEIGVALHKIKSHFTPEIAYRINKKYDQEKHKWQENEGIIVFKLRVKY